MRSYDEAYAAAKDKPAFSNGTEGYSWTANWCDTCTHDRSARDETRYPPDPANKGLLGCPLLAVAMMHQRTPVEWTEKPWQQIKGRPEGETAPVLGDTYHCVAYEHDPDTDEDGGGDDRPPPDPCPPPVCEGQVDMFEVFADQIVEHVESAVMA